MLADTQLPEFLWESVVTHAVYLWNIAYTSSPKLRDQAPYQVWYGKKPNVSHLREFGTPVWVLLQGQNVQRKMLPKFQHRAYVSYNKGSKAVNYYNAGTKKVLTARNFCFLQPEEHAPPEEIGIDPIELEGGNASPSEGGGGSGTTQRDNPRKRKQGEESDIDLDKPWKTRGIRPDYKYMNDPFPDKEEASIVEVREEAYTVILDDDCCDLHEAKQSPEWPEWEQAIRTELDQLEKMGTWELVEKPRGVVPIANKFVFTKKHNKEGNLLKYKARLVTKGCFQRPGQDYVKTHSPIVRLETIRVLLAIAVKHKLIIYQMDIKGTYLNGVLKEKVYMKQPEGFDDRSRCICQLIKMLYSLKQAG